MIVNLSEKVLDSNRCELGNMQCLLKRVKESQPGYWPKNQNMTP